MPRDGYEVRVDYSRSSQRESLQEKSDLGLVLCTFGVWMVLGGSQVWAAGSEEKVVN